MFGLPDFSSLLDNEDDKEEKFSFSEFSLFFRDELQDLNADTFKALCLYNALSEEDKEYFKELLDSEDLIL